MSENPLIDQIIKDLKWHCSSWKCHVYMNMKGYDTKLDLFTDPSPMDIFSFTESKMRSATNHWFLDDFQYPTHSLKDVVASLQSNCLDAGTPLVVRDYYKQSCTLQCKYHRIHRGKTYPKILSTSKESEALVSLEISIGVHVEYPAKHQIASHQSTK